MLHYVHVYLNVLGMNALFTHTHTHIHTHTHTHIHTHSLIRDSAPLINVIIILGCILMLGSCYLLGIDTRTPSLPGDDPSITDDDLPVDSSILQKRNERYGDICNVSLGGGRESISRSVSQSVIQSIIQSGIHSVKHSVKQSVSQSVSQ